MNCGNFKPGQLKGMRKRDLLPLHLAGCFLFPDAISVGMLVVYNLNVSLLANEFFIVDAGHNVSLSCK